MLAADPAEAICDLVEEKQADFLVMGHREMHPLKRFILGSGECCLLWLVNKHYSLVTSGTKSSAEPGFWT